ncbi:MAG: hypothetical protein IJA35_00650 [Clostridia bacterium]|nr:hypothetical protein [Oscillospiraceae bacterium]MBQ3551658.1 hypothetical protein [Clostridia bacterium]
MPSEIKLCAECGNPFKAQFYESYCSKCNKKFEREEFLEEAAVGKEVYCGDNPVCPWCGEEYEADFEDPDYYREGEHAMTCPECGKEYCLSITVSYSYDACRELPKWMAEDRRRTEEVS